jgi:ABC-type nitrate/sulfonate/bicarbonate transport system substrate-binding protein
MRCKIFVSAVLLCLVTGGCATPAPTPAPTQTSVPPPAASVTPTPRKSGTIHFFDIINIDVRDVPMLMAFDTLAAQGYTIEKQYFATSPLIADGLARGDADIGLLNDQTMWTAIAKGAKVRTIAGSVAATFLIATRNEIQDCHALDGKSLGLPSLTGVNPALLDLYLKQNCAGIAPKFVVIPDAGARDAALISGQVDSVMFPSEDLFKVDQQAPGKFHTIIPLSQAFPDVQVDGLHVRQAWAEQNPEMVKDFLRAVLDANRRVQANPQVLYDESVKRLNIDQATAKQIGDSYLKLQVWDPNGGLTATNVQFTIDFLTKNAGLTPGLKAQDVSDLSYLNAVLGEIGRK